MWDCRWIPSFAGLLFWSGQVDAPPARSLFWGSVKQIAWSDRLSLPSNVNNKTGHAVGHGPLLASAQTSGLLKGNTKQTDSPGQVTWVERHLDPRSPRGSSPTVKAPFPLKVPQALRGPVGPRGACELLMELRTKQVEKRMKSDGWGVKTSRSGGTDDLWPQADEKGGARCLNGFGASFVQSITSSPKVRRQRIVGSNPTTCQECLRKELKTFRPQLWKQAGVVFWAVIPVLFAPRFISLTAKLVLDAAYATSPHSHCICERVI